MEKEVFPCEGAFLYPLKNLTGSLTRECEISFFLSVQSEIADAGEYALAGGKAEIRDILQKSLPGFLKETLREIKGDAVYYGSAFSGPKTEWEEAAGRRIGELLSRYGMCGVSVIFSGIGIAKSDCEILREHEDEEKLRKIQKAATENISIDLCYNPSRMGAPGTAGFKQDGVPFSPALPAWDCTACGARNNTGRFCPECGSPSGRWLCVCGKVNTTGFCPECGRPAKQGTTI